MRVLDHSFDDAACNLALDEVMLREAGEQGEVLRFWESASPFVVLGLTQQIRQEVEIERCAAAGVPIMRRCSAGGCVVQGPGCLNFTLVLSKEARPEIESIHGSYEYILGRVVESLGVAGLVKAGISDLAIGALKVSGNAQRRHKDYILHHGTLLYDADIPVFSSYIKEPDERPEYRGSRSHEAFVTNLGVSRERLVEMIAGAFELEAEKSGLGEALLEKVRVLAEDKYGQESWIYRK